MRSFVNNFGWLMFGSNNRFHIETFPEVRYFLSALYVVDAGINYKVKAVSINFTCCSFDVLDEPTAGLALSGLPE